MLAKSLRWLMCSTIALTLCATVVVCPARADDDDADVEKNTITAPSDSTESGSKPSSKPGQGGMVLQGGIKHSEQLPGLPEGLQIGKVYSDDLLNSRDAQGDNNEWFLIPEWYAGVRHCEEEVIVFRYMYDTGVSSTPMMRQLNRQDSVSGYQRDANGGIWDFKRVPRIQHVESSFENAVLYVKKIELLAETADKLEIKYVNLSIGISKRTGKITSIVQQEQISTVTSPVPRVLRTDVSVKAFGPDGKPQRQEQAVIMADITKPYEQIDQYEGQDLRPLFRDFLISHGLEKLVPKDLQKH